LIITKSSIYIILVTVEYEKFIILIIIELSIYYFLWLPLIELTIYCSWWLSVKSKGSHVSLTVKSQTNFILFEYITIYYKNKKYDLKNNTYVFNLVFPLKGSSNFSTFVYFKLV